jgi:CheY-like chemotaxis protein
VGGGGFCPLLGWARSPRQTHRNPAALECGRVEKDPGRQFLKRTHQLAKLIHERQPQVPVLFVSGWAGGLSDTDALERLRWDFLPKPFTEAQLVTAVRRLLSR